MSAQPELPCPSLPPPSTLPQSPAIEADRFGELVHSQRPMLLRLVQRCGFLPQDADEIVQDALLKALQHLEQFRGEARVSTWLTRIVVNECYMRHRWSRRYLYVDFESPERQAEPGLVEDEPSPLDDAMREQQRVRVRREVARLPSKLREVLVLRDFLQLDLHATAKMLQLKTAAVKTRHFRARRMLRLKLQHAM